MNNAEVNKFARECLNETGLRLKIREGVPHIDRLESLDSLRDLTLTKIVTDPIFLVWYEGIATNELYPHIRANLIRMGVINRDNALNSSVKNKGQQNEYEQVRFGVAGSSIQVVVKAYNPNYKQDIGTNII